MNKIAILKIGDEEYALNMKPKDFKTGSKGYNISGKIELEGKKYQIGCNIVEIGSKPKKE